MKSGASTDAQVNPNTSIRKSAKPSSDVVLLELRGGRPSLLLDLGGGAVTLTLNTTYTLADNTWHRIDLIWKDEVGSIYLMVMVIFLSVFAVSSRVNYHVMQYVI